MTLQISVTTRANIRKLKLEAAGVLPPGAVMWCRGRKLIRIGKLRNLELAPESADTLCVSPDDLKSVQEAIR